MKQSLAFLTFQRQNMAKAQGKRPSESHSSSAPADHEPHSSCFICTEPIHIYSIGPCNHPVCHLCSLRLRALYKTSACSLCKLDMPQILFASSSMDFESPLAGSLQRWKFKDEKLQIYFQTRDLFSKTMDLLGFKCPECQQSCPKGWAQLHEHCVKSHSKRICQICAKHKKVFTTELVLYTPEELQTHLDQGVPTKDEGSFKGHPTCGFCRIHFYSKDELFLHCRESHETCFICKRLGLHQDVYFENYSFLDEHFKKEHWVCTERECLEKKFVVFESDIDLKAHQLEEHKDKFKKGRGTTSIELNFQYSTVGRGSISDHQRFGRNRSSNNNSTRGSNHNNSNNRPGPSRGDVPISRTSSTESIDPAKELPSPHTPPTFVSSNNDSSVRESQQQQEEPRLAERLSGRVPLGFGSGLTPTPAELATLSSGPPRNNGSSFNSSKRPSSPSSAATTRGEPLEGVQIGGNPEVASRLQTLFSSDPHKFQEFKSLALSFKNSVLSADDFLQGLLSMCLEGKSMMLKQDIEAQVGKLWHRLVETFPSDDSGGFNSGSFKRKGVPLPLGPNQQQTQRVSSLGKKEQMLSAWNNFKASGVSFFCLTFRENVTLNAHI